MRRTFFLLFTAIALSSAIARSQEYTVTDLGTLDGGISVAAGVNNSGQVTGDIEIPGDQGNGYNN